MEFSGVKEHIEKNKEAMLNDLSFLISIPSVAVRTEGNAPFGENVQRAYEAMMKMAEREGFETFNADNFGGHIDFPGSGEGIVESWGTWMLCLKAITGILTPMEEKSRKAL